MSVQREYLKAAEGRTVRREGSAEFWPEAGDWAELTTFVRRRLDDGDLVKADPPSEPEAEQPPVVDPTSKPEAETPRKPKGDPKPEAAK